MIWSLYRSDGLPSTSQMKCPRSSSSQEGGVCLPSRRLAYALQDGQTKIQIDKLTHIRGRGWFPGLRLKGGHLMNKKAVKIKLGNVVYQVEREFIGTVSREELLINRLVEDGKSRPSQNEADSAIEKPKKDS